MLPSKAARERAASATAPLFMLAVNLAISWRLFRTEYVDQLPSIEGAFIALDRYILRHWPGYDWFPLWYGGFPFARTYQPAFHYAVASLAALTGLSVPSAYHAMAAMGYSLGGVAFYYVVRTLSGDRAAAFFGALVFSLFSPSVLLLSAVRHDVGGPWNARRLQAMVEYGEAPNIAGLTLGMFALALLYRAIWPEPNAHVALRSLFAAIAIAAVIATNWPATMALVLAVVAFLLAMDAESLKARFPRILAIGALAWGLACPFALPSTILSTFHNAGIMTDGPTPGATRWISISLLILTLISFRAIQARSGVPFRFRFSLLYLAILLWVVLSAAYFNVRILPQPMRFHVAMEIALTLAATLFLQWFAQSLPNVRKPIAIIVALFCLFQFPHFRNYARHHLIKPLDFPKTLESQEAFWFDRNVKDGRVLAPGTVSFWMNTVTDTPQTVGCCEQSVLSHVDFILAYITAAGYRTEAETADYTLLWMKAWAVQAFAIGGPNSREHYKAFNFPGRFRNKLPLAWSSGDDYIYRVPERAPGLARVVAARDLVRHAPENGIDDRELRPFVAALDDPDLPIAAYAAKGPNEATIRAAMQPDQAVSVAVSYHTGWTASVEGRPVTTHSDGLGLIAIEPHCAGDCTIALRWSPGPEPWLAWLTAVLSLTGALVWCWRENRPATN